MPIHMNRVHPIVLSATIVVGVALGAVRQAAADEQRTEPNECALATDEQRVVPAARHFVEQQ